MDPKETVKRLRRLTKQAQASQDAGDFDYLMIELASNFESLDRWMSQGGFNPWSELNKGFDDE